MARQKTATPKSKTRATPQKKTANPLGKRRIVICLDGTWNEPEQLVQSGRKKETTNVLKMVRAVMPRAKDGADQIVYYDAGVGTQGALDKFLGGGFGQGLSQNIMEAYRFLANNYADGDEIFLFGFSRGAYTARALAGLIGVSGLLTKDYLAYVPEAYQHYRSDTRFRCLSRYLFHLDGIPDARRLNVPIKFIGVWDTVGALGPPTPLLGRLTKSSLKFHNHRLGANVKNAYHALSVDERRGPFRPNLWIDVDGQGQTVEQVWFAGVHSNIGGAYKDCTLSNITLDWMARKAADLGLALAPGVFLKGDLPAQTGRIEKSYGFLYAVLHALGAKKHTRRIGPRQSGHLSGEPPGINQSVHPSAVKAIGQRFRHIKGKNKCVWQPKNLTKALADDLPTAR